MNENNQISDNGDENVDEKHNAFGKKFKHTLDSDEEDDEIGAEKYNVLDDDAIEGTERTTIEFDGDIKITPFNMDEELETGHFDKEGTYIFKKENDIRDNWLDNINWNVIKPTKTETIKKDEINADQDSSSDENEETTISQASIKEFYEQIILLVQPGESIRKAIQRYGKLCNPERKGQKRKIHSNEATTNQQSSDKNEAKEKMMKLISIADQILQTGDMDIYERTFEQFKLQLNKINDVESIRKQSSDNNDDMFSDDFDDKKQSTSKTVISMDETKTKWEYRWEDKDNAQIYGPYSSEDMLNWTNQGYFDQGVFVRRIESTDARFYSSKRIDFELYI
ncbi:CD2 antigen cytoplasmic tail-binding protein 2 [Dermatophagoides farinae]|uniref:CD2 antigen cytoplasmic tail-binding protein 2 n=1 Tax=Dermatophagoides farinae TaxID=6954 RepID=A0A922HMN7_DERFA|nr:CD2 antigen cytoplasmic tail-binding protein 2 [Dermatophagoides farinae]